MILPLSEAWRWDTGWLDAQPDNDFNRRMDALEDRLAKQAREFSGYDPDAAPDLEDGYGN